ncbi:MAG: Nif11-like leader peptide family natural product precursor [Synergistaceae bacterium]|nr:Nif11-like leader peptide family natural product precursor [Synergistaceae bacterium]
MTNNAKKFLAAVSKDEALKKELMAAKSMEDVLKLANANGYELKAVDFEPAKMDELSEDEMQAVAGGATNEVTSVCRCQGYGSGLTWELNCECQKTGEGYNTTNNGWRCGCGGSFGVGMA